MYKIRDSVIHLTGSGLNTNIVPLPFLKNQKISFAQNSPLAIKGAERACFTYFIYTYRNM
jgi:hypothetical protein